MNKIDCKTIKDILSKTGLSINDMRIGPTVVFIEKEQFSLSVKKDKLVVKQLKKFFAPQYRFDLSEFS